MDLGAITCARSTGTKGWTLVRMHSVAAAASVEYVLVQTVNQRLRDCTNSRKIYTHPKDRRITMTSPPVNLSLLGGCRRRLTLLVRGHLPAGYSHEMAERRRGAKEREEKEAGRGKSEEGRWQRRRTVYSRS